jgi:hypothetical protein
MTPMQNLTEKAKTALRGRFAGRVDAKGYVSFPQDNLIEGVRFEDFEQDLRSGAGDELRTKFCAVHSSSAIVANTFAPFKEKPADLILLGQQGFEPPIFEKTIPTGLGGTPPHLDVWLKRGGHVMAVESKLTEHLAPKQAEFRESYQRSALPYAEDCWWDVLTDAKSAGKRYLDVAQLVKHYLGLVRFLREKKPESATLLYLFWEPTNAMEFDACRRHRDEVAKLAESVGQSDIIFRWTTYDQLWNEWLTQPHLSQHARNLKTRYESRFE